MKDKLNNKKKNPHIIDAFFNLNGRNASEDELNILEGNIDNNFNNEDAENETNLDNENNDNENNDNENNNNSITIANSITEI